jgi:isopentenyl diphosphate isomerase/L-lactate dehydrogenase-like FMN-dependent dehydrogenase
MAGLYLRAAAKSPKALDEQIRIISAQLRIAMLATGARDLDALQQTPLIHDTQEP